ncbi:MAG: 4a-hydroxytetrahydrobiopterin dehydratase [Rhodospirillales bacterium]|nr:4a-hydroxytetrahydrobiopterin dehydratase [Rhodospirillales bacterium]
MGGDLAEKVCTPCRGGIPPLTRDEANALLKQTPAWTIVDDPMRIERRFAFGNFRDALMFVDRVGAVAEAENHHPDIRFGWGYCCVEIYTHKIKGLHENDFILASKIDALETS